jgi:lysophospholipase L1-like esterase
MSSIFRRVLLRLALVVAGLTVALGMGECLARVLDLSPEIAHVEKGRYRLSLNPRIGYEPVPGLAYDGKSLHFYDYRGAANSLGYRDREHQVRKLANTYRVVVLGDSIAAGHLVSRLEDIFARVIERELAAEPRTVEVLNFAVSGYNTQQEVETLRERALAFSPDLVLLAYCLNDREQNDGGILATLRREADGREGFLPSSSFLHRSALFRFVWYRVLEAHNPRGIREQHERLSEDTVEQSFADLAKLSRTHGFQVLVAVFPDFRDLSDYQFADQHEFVAELSARHDFWLLDLLPVMKDCGGRVARDRYHPNERGHRCAGVALAEKIQQLVQSSP